MKILPIFLLLGGLVVSAPATALDIEEGKEAAWRGDYAAALAVFRPLAEQGNAEAQYSLAGLYRDGRGVARDDQAAVRWYRRAAEGGSWWAALDLGLFYWGQVQAAESGGGGPGERLMRVHMWLGIAAAQEDTGCVELAAPLLNAVAQSMTAAQIAEAEKHTRAWLAARAATGVNLAAADPGC